MLLYLASIILIYCTTSPNNKFFSYFVPATKLQLQLAASATNTLSFPEKWVQQNPTFCTSIHLNIPSSRHRSLDACVYYKTFRSIQNALNWVWTQRRPFPIWWAKRSSLKDISNQSCARFSTAGRLTSSIPCSCKIPWFQLALYPFRSV